MTRDELVAFFQREGYIVCLDEEQDPDVASFADGPHGEHPHGVVLNPREREPGTVYRPAHMLHNDWPRPA